MFIEKDRLSVSDIIKHEELVKGRELGKGGFGVVYQGTYRHNPVAIKQLLTETISAEAAGEFAREAHTMAKLRSPNIVQFYGYCVTPNYCIVMEYMPNGSLFSLLRSTQPLDWPTRFRIAVDMAKGLSFLHHENILHRDIKSLNVLLGEDKQGYVAKLTDFGLSKVKTETRSHMSATKTKSDSVGTLQWMAPELFEDDKVAYTQQCDIYSLGITFWELASRQIPFKNAANPALIPIWIGKGKREDIPADCPKSLAALITTCWDGDAAKRPNSNDVVRRLLGATTAFDAASPAALASGPQYIGNFGSASSGASNTSSGMSAAAASGGSAGNAALLPDVERAAIEELLKEASVNERLEDFDDAKAAYEQAVVRAKAAKKLPGMEILLGKVYGLYGEYLSKRGETQAASDKFRIAESFGYKRAPSSPAPARPAPAPAPAAAPPKPQVDAKALAKFLLHVASGEQPEAEAMLKQSRDLALVPGDVTDLSGRTFKGITGFQYALWALDWHMWTMIQKYLPEEAAREQVKGLESGGWVSQHKKSCDWQNLLAAQQKFLDLMQAKKWEDASTQWQKQVGGAQRLLPVHVVNEYCHPSRPFEPCPNFTSSPLPRSRTTDEGDFYTAKYNGGLLGEMFAVCRGSAAKAQAWRGDVGGWRGIWSGATYAMQDRQACHTLLVTRTRQRDQLLAALAKGANARPKA